MSKLIVGTLNKSHQGFPIGTICFSITEAGSTYCIMKEVGSLMKNWKCCRTGHQVNLDETYSTEDETATSIFWVTFNLIQHEVQIPAYMMWHEKFIQI